jgi:putative Holliday junction resolvase
MRFLAIDFGESRIGLATSDATGSIATPRVTIARGRDASAIRRLVQFCADEEVDAVVVGLPRREDGSAHPLAARIRSFAKKLSEATALPIAFHDETRTSQEGRRRVPPGSPREAVDREAAAVLLEDYLAERTRAGRR